MHHWSPLPLLSLQQIVSLSQSSRVSPVYSLLTVKGVVGERGWARSQIIRPPERLTLYKSFNTLWVKASISCIFWQQMVCGRGRYLNVHICISNKVISYQIARQPEFNLAHCKKTDNCLATARFIFYWISNDRKKWKLFGIFFSYLRKFNKHKIAILTVYIYLRITDLIVHNLTFHLSDSTRGMSEETLK
jgi:hypothetical protein